MRTALPAALLAIAAVLPAQAQVLPGQAIPDGVSFQAAPPSSAFGGLVPGDGRPSAPAATNTLGTGAPFRPQPPGMGDSIWGEPKPQPTPARAADPVPAKPTPAAKGPAPQPPAAAAPSAAALPPPGTRLRGNARALDGATLALDGMAVRLAGLTAPPPGMPCFDTPVSWACGNRARSALDSLAGRGPVTCVVAGADGGVLVATCRIGRDDMASAMVETGMAKSALPAHREAMGRARADGRGLWSE